MSGVLADYVAAKKRFSRSANVERDQDVLALDGYVPTGRAIDVVDRIARGLLDPSAGRAFSITGPHGGGKSSLAVFVSALLSPSTSAEYRTAIRLLTQADAATANKLKEARKALGLAKAGVVQATATSRIESVAQTIARGLHRGAENALGKNQTVVPAAFASDTKPVPGLQHQVLDAIQEVCAERPTLLVVDEFGKNLEAYARAQDDGDPYLLQQIAELTQGQKALPLVVITMQHLSFDEYVQDASATRRREWAKVQGRFQDIPYVETPEQSRRLICESLDQKPEYSEAVRKWVGDHESEIVALNLRDIATDCVGAAPLHPIVLAVLPELCVRYGQNERTLFSFVGGSEPAAVPELLGHLSWQPGDSPVFVGIDHVYDYFVESARSLVGVSQSASRWLEIETRIRDTAGLSDLELRALKTIGLLNLVSTGGKIRASRELVRFALETGGRSDAPHQTTDGVLEQLEKRGLVSYRTFSDEYRIWQGSDYDIKRAVTSARRQVETDPLDQLLNNAAQLQPTVAGRHSQRGGILRIFGQQFGTHVSEEQIAAELDGVVLYLTTTADDAIDAGADADRLRPVVRVVPNDLAAIRNTAVEAATLRRTLDAAIEEEADWVAVRELSERAAAAQQTLLSEISRTWDADASWSVPGVNVSLVPESGLSSVLSDVADVVYSAAPEIRNEMISRRELTSQGAKARRFLIDAMLDAPAEEAFGIEGYGPERAIYEAVLRWTGTHRRQDDGVWAIGTPRDRKWKQLWSTLTAAVEATEDKRVSLAEITRVVELPPYGLKSGVLPVVVIALLLSRRDDVALYEHGSLVLEIDDAVAERLAKNPWHFAVRNSATKGAARSAVVTALAQRMGVRAPGGAKPTFLNVTSALFRELRLIPPFAQKTKASVSDTAGAIRDAFHTATEPDVLLFETLPGILGVEKFGSRGRKNTRAAHVYADRLADVVGELRDCYPRALDSIANHLAEATSLPADLPELQPRLRARAVELNGRVLEPRLRAFVGSLTRDLEPQAWLENIAMVVSDGQAPRVWTDDLAARFPLRVAELGGAMRRTEALLYDRLARGPHEGFQTTRIAFTRPDGTEWNEIVAIDDSDRERIEAPFGKLLDGLTQQYGSRSAACRMLMARLAMEELGNASNTEHESETGARHA
uniref:hypothetical protein n=1 Tax=Gordonia sp. B7-2 TaxID=3420932 RepID=UPI003D94447D